MNGVALAFLAFLVLVLQSALAGRVELAGARPDWILVFVVFLGLYARGPQAIVAGLVLGASADLLTLERFGLLATSYAAAGATVAGVREFLFRYRATTQFVVTLAAALLLQAAWLVHRRLAYSAAAIGYHSLGLALLASVYSAAWAPIIHGGLLRAARWIGVPRPKYRFSEMHSGGMDA